MSKHRIVTALAVTMVVGLWPAAAEATQAAPATVAAGRHGPGRPVAVEPLPAALWLPGTATAYRIHYSSTGFAGRSVVVSGAVFMPAGRTPKRGWPVVSWAHGTVGVADRCAQSVAGRSARDIEYLAGWLKAGYAVVATE